MTHDWEIRSRGHVCSVCGVAFADGQACFSSLFWGPAGYERHDYCEGCRETGDRSHPPFSAWQGIYRVPPAAPEEPLKKETAESLLRKLIANEDMRDADVMYILAVMLERKRIFVEKDVRMDPQGARHRIYEHRRTGETFLILDPGLQVERLAEVQQRVVALLNGRDSAPQGCPSASEPSAASPTETPQNESPSDEMPLPP